MLWQYVASRLQTSVISSNTHARNAILFRIIRLVVLLAFFHLWISLLKLTAAAMEDRDSWLPTEVFDGIQDELLSGWGAGEPGSDSGE